MENSKLHFGFIVSRASGWLILLHVFTKYHSKGSNLHYWQKRCILLGVLLICVKITVKCSWVQTTHGLEEHQTENSKGLTPTTIDNSNCSGEKLMLPLSNDNEFGAPNDKLYWKRNEVTHQWARQFNIATKQSTTGQGPAGIVIKEPVGIRKGPQA